MREGVGKCLTNVRSVITGEREPEDGKGEIGNWEEGSGWWEMGRMNWEVRSGWWGIGRINCDAKKNVCLGLGIRKK